MYSYVAVQAVSGMPQVQADISESFFADEDDAPISANDVSKRLKSEVHHAKERKESKVKLTTKHETRTSLSW